MLDAKYASQFRYLMTEISDVRLLSDIFCRLDIYIATQYTANIFSDWDTSLGRVSLHEGISVVPSEVLRTCTICTVKFCSNYSDILLTGSIEEAGKFKEELMTLPFLQSFQIMLTCRIFI
jgi:hypothetical protein